MNTSIIGLLMFVLGGGGGDLLDYVPTETYWRDQNVAFTVESLVAELKTPPPADASAAIADLEAADPKVRQAAADKILKLGPGAIAQVHEAETSPSAEIAPRAHSLMPQLTAMRTRFGVRRLMAIRALGELKNPQAVVALQPFLESKVRFESDYATRAIAAINGSPTTAPTSAPAILPATAPAVAAATSRDVWLLPAACRAVGQISPRGRRPVALRRDAPRLLVRSNQDPQVVIHDMATMALSVAEQIGNVRLATLTVGISGHISDKTGFAVAIASGDYDAQAVIAVARAAKIPSRTVNGMDVFQPDGETAFFLTDDHQLVLLASPGGEQYPLEEMIAAVRKKEGGLRAVPEMSKLIESIDTSQPVWAVTQVTDSYRSAPLLRWLDSVTMVGKPTADGLRLTAHGEAKDADAAKGAARDATGLALGAVAEMKLLEPIVPAMKAAGETFATVHCDADGKTVTATAEAKDSPTLLYMLPLFATFGTHDEIIPPPAPVRR